MCSDTQLFIFSFFLAAWKQAVFLWAGVNMIDDVWKNMAQKFSYLSKLTNRPVNIDKKNFEYGKKIESGNIRIINLWDKYKNDIRGYCLKINVYIYENENDVVFINKS